MNRRNTFACAVITVMVAALLIIALPFSRKNAPVYADQVVHYSARRTVVKQLNSSNSMTYYVIEPDNAGTYPAVIMFHGMGGVGDVRDLEARANNWMASGTLDPVVFIVPDIGPNTGDVSHAFNKTKIGNTDKTKLDFLIEDIESGAASSKIDTSADLSVAGFSLGGCSSLDAGIRRHDVIVNVGAFSSSSLFYPNPPYTVNWGWYTDPSRIVYSSDPDAHRFLTASATETHNGNPYTAKKTVEFYASIMPEEYPFTTYIFSSGEHDSNLLFRELYMYLYYIQNDVLPTEEQCRSATYDTFTTPTTTTATSTTAATTTTAAPTTTASTTTAPAATTTVAPTTSITTAAATTQATSATTAATTAPTETTTPPAPVAPAPSGEVLNTSIGPVSVNYSTHVQNIGWQEYVRDGVMAGTEGQSLRLEAMAVNVESDMDLGVRYCTHVQNIGWQDWKYNGEAAGTEGLSYRLEGLKIELTGSEADNYDIYYRVHVQNIGWMNWVSNGQMAGTEGQSLRLEGLQIKIVPKGTSPDIISYNTHVENIGWQGYVTDGVMAGTTGRSLRLEGIHIDVTGLEGVGVEYRTHIQNIGWEEGWTADGGFSGTEGQSLRLEAIEIRLTGENASSYDIYYRVHVQNFGWTGWASNGASCGSAGYSYRLEGIEIMVLPAGSPAPGSTANAFYQA